MVNLPFSCSRNLGGCLIKISAGIKLNLEGGGVWSTCGIYFSFGKEGNEHLRGQRRNYWDCYNNNNIYSPF
jgi:hypothetical protein